MNHAADRDRTVTKSTRASRFFGSCMVKVCSGGVRYQLSSRLDATAARTAGQNPPTTVTVTTASRKTSRSSARFRCWRAATRSSVSSGRPASARATPDSRRRELIAPVQATRSRRGRVLSAAAGIPRSVPSPCRSPLTPALTYPSVTRAASQRNSTPRAPLPSAVTPITSAASAAAAPVGRRSAYGGRENPATVSQPMAPSGTDASGSAISAVTPTTIAAAISTPVAGSRPLSAAATVPTANSAAKAAGSAYGAGTPRRPLPRVISLPFDRRIGQNLTILITP